LQRKEPQHEQALSTPRIQDIRDIKILSDYRSQLYAAVCLSVINSLEKILRFDRALTGV
jgi:hypothetical protein